MEAENTKLIIHTTAGPGTQGCAVEKPGKGTLPARPRATRGTAGEVTVWGGLPDSAAVQSPKGKRTKGHRQQMQAEALNNKHVARGEEKPSRLAFYRVAQPPRPIERKTPQTDAAAAEEARKKHPKGQAVAYRNAGVPHQTGRILYGEASAEAAQPNTHTANACHMPRPRNMRKNRHRPVKPRLTFGERLLRNSAIACALLLAVLAARNIDTPWARAAVEGVERALTMKIDLDGSLGSLSFVRGLMPESVLVFFDLPAEGELAQPVDGTLEKHFSEEQPWVEFSCAPDAEVVAAEAGTVVATTQLSGGGWGVMVEHDNGLESVCAYLLEPLVQAGERVGRGQCLAYSEAGRVYFEVRRDGTIIDPAPLIGA